MQPAAMDTRPHPKVCVIGTSNSAGAGSYAGELARNSWFHAVENRALGFCTSDLFAFRKAGLDFADFDLCILDFAPNDGALLTGKRLDLDRIQQALTYAVSEISRAGCLPIINIVPIVNLMPEGRGIRRAYLKIAERYGVPFFDGYAFLNRLLAVEPSTAELGLFKDRMHFTQEVAKLVGECLGEALRQLWAGPIAFDAPLTMTTANAYKFWPAEELFPGHPVIHRQTAMIEAKFVQFMDETTMRLTLPAETEVTSLVADFSRCRGVLSLTGDEGTTRLGVSSKTFTEDPAAKMTVGIYPFPVTVKSKDGAIELALTAGGPADHSVGIEASPQDSARLTIAGLVARGPRTPIPMRRMVPEAVDLAALVPDQRLMAAKARLAPPSAFVATGKLGYE